MLGRLPLLLWLLLLASAGCDPKQPSAPIAKPPTPAPPSSSPTTPTTPIPRPSGILALDQHLFFADDTSTSQGMGFLARTPAGNTAIVTSAHFLDFDGPRLRSIEWTVFADGKAQAVARATNALGKPGNEGTINRTAIDLSSDYLILVPDGPVAITALTPILRLDHRQTIPRGERIWLPYLDILNDAPKQELFEGTVIESVPGTTLIELDKPVELIAASGSPVISQETGRVIGTISRGITEKGKAQILLAPSWSILKAMREAEAANEHPLLETVVGKDQPPRPVNAAPRGPVDED